MLRIAASVPAGKVLQGPQRKKRETREEKLKRLAQASVRKTKGSNDALRGLPWPLFLQALQNKRDIVVRAHVRWCMNRAVRACETLKRAEGRAFDLRPGGRHNIVAQGGMWYEGKSGPERVHHDDASAMWKHGRYFVELEDNLRRLCCPEWAIPVAKRWVRIKLALGWDLNMQGDAVEGQSAV